MLAICTTNEPIVFQAPKTIRPADKMEPEGKKPRAKTRQRRKFVPLTMNNPLKKKSGTTKDKNLNQPSASTHMVVELYKEALQATSGPASLGVTGEVRADPQLISVVSVSLTEPVFSAFTIIQSKSASRNDASADFIAEADPRKSAPKDLLSQQQEMKLDDLSELVKDKGTEAIDLDNPEEDQPLMVLIDEDEEVHLEKEKAAAEAEAALLFAQPTFPNVQQLTKLVVNEINETLGDLKKYVEELEIEVATLKNIKLDFPARLLALPEQVSSFNVQFSRLKILDVIPSLLNKLTEAPNMFANAIESTSQKAGVAGVAIVAGVPSVGRANSHPAEGEKYTNQATIT
ncbi:hypothetical protein Tco_1048326 [Tanacetum coccineum]